MLGLNFFRNREKFLLIDIAPKRTSPVESLRDLYGASGLLISIDDENRIRPEKFWDEFSFNKLSRDPLSILRKHKIVVSAHPSFSTTISAPVEFGRDEADIGRPIGVAELENIFSKEINVFFGKHRGEVGRRLRLNELDVVLVEAAASDFKIDGHVVLNPAGFRGRKISAILELTFMARSIFEDLKPFFNLREGFFFTPASRAYSFALSRLDSASATLAFLDSESSYYILFSESFAGRFIKEEELDWSFSRILSSIAAAAGTSKRATLEIYSRYLSGAASPHFLAVVRRTVRPAIDGLLGLLKSKQPKGVVYVYSPLPLPFFYPMSVGRAEIKIPDPDAIAGKFGFKLDARDWKMSKSDIFSRIAPFFGFYFDKKSSDINKRLKRRLHWLIQ